MVEEIPALKGFVARVLLSAPDASAKEIMDAARRRYAVVDALTPREFAARYVTPLKRRMGGARPRAGSRSARQAPPRPERPRVTERARTADAPADEGSGSALLDAVIADRRRWTDGEETAREPGDVEADAASARTVEPPPALGDGVTPANGSARPPAAAPAEALAPAENGALVHRSTKGERRAALRLLFMRLALEITAADTDPDFVQVVGRIDRYVDEALKV